MKPQAETRWKRRKDERPAEIMAAALDCFKERGFSATRLDEVAAGAGYAKVRSTFTSEVKRTFSKPSCKTF